ncbi:hypothetical protein GCM10028812_42760 [Ancylobacter sonchi]|nr:hypothetical protein [Ancylobacter sonchi]
MRDVEMQPQPVDQRGAVATGARSPQRRHGRVDLRQAGPVERGDDQLAWHHRRQRIPEGDGERGRQAGQRADSAAMGVDMADVELDAQVAQPAADEVEGLRVLLDHLAGQMALQHLGGVAHAEADELDLHADPPFRTAGSDRAGGGGRGRQGSDRHRPCLARPCR